MALLRQAVALRSVLAASKAVTATPVRRSGTAAAGSVLSSTSSNKVPAVEGPRDVVDTVLNRKPLTSKNNLVGSGYKSADGYFEKSRVAEQKDFVYFTLGAQRFVFASVGRLAVVRFLATLMPAADTLAMAFADFDLADMEPATTINVTWRGKPIFIRRRTKKEIDDMRAVTPEELRDWESDEDRCPNPEFNVVIGICTHLGCVPVANAGDYGGYFCPCHGSHYDYSGRIRKGPAPLNLEVPPYRFEDKTIIIG